MAQDRIEYWDAMALIAHARTLVSFRRAIDETLRSIRFGGVYFLAPVVADRRVGRIFWNVGFPKEWENAYRQSGRWEDPLPNISLNRTSAFRWSDAGKIATLDKCGASYLDKLKRANMGEGVAVYCTGPYVRSGFVGVGLPHNSAALDDAMVRQVQAAAQLCFQRYCELVGAFNEEVPDLSQRELDVVRWIGEGKSNGVIAQILGISKNSVDSYVKRVFAKLNVSNRTAAAVRAVSLGLIAPGKHSRAAAHRPRWLN